MLVSAGVNEKQNKYCTLVRAITSFSTMCQGSSEFNNSFRKRVDANAWTMELSGMEHVIYSPTISQVYGPDKPTPEKKGKEVQNFKAMIMILRANPVGHFDSL